MPRLMRNPVDEYNELVEYIVQKVLDTLGQYPHACDAWSYDVYSLIDLLAEAAAYKAKYEQLISDDIKHSHVIMGEMFKAAVEIGNLRDQGEKDERS